MEYVDAVALIKKYDIDFAEGSIVRSVDEALKAAEYPVALKIMSDEISHKSDKGCVKLNVKDEDSLRKAYSEIMSNVGSAKVDGVLVQRMAKPGLELIVGGGGTSSSARLSYSGSGDIRGGFQGLLAESMSDRQERCFGDDKRDEGLSTSHRSREQNQWILKRLWICCRKLPSSFTRTSR